MTALEQTYRSALRWYPNSWRRRNEDAVLGTLLDVADEQHRTTPAKGELSNLRNNGLAVRLGPLGRIPAPVRDRVTALTFGLGSGIAIVALVSNAIFRSQLPPDAGPLMNLVGPFVGYSFLEYGFWIAALVAALIGLRWVARALTVLALMVAITVRLVPAGVGFGFASTTTTIVLIGLLGAMSFLGNPFRSGRGRIWIAVATASWAAFIGGSLWYQRASEGGVAGRTDWFIGPFSEWMGWLFPLVIILSLILWRTTKTPWAPAILLTEIPIILFALLGWQNPTTLWTIAAYGIAIAATLTGCWLLLKGFGLKIRITRT